MYNEHEKRILILDMLKILHKYTDQDHRLSQANIIDILQKEYNIKVERKTVKRNIEDLIEYGDRDDANEILYNVSTRTGKNEDTIEVLSDYGIVHDFTHGELRLIIEGLLFSKHIPKGQRKDLIRKLEGLSSKYFNSRIDHISTMDDSGPKNSNLFLNIEILDEVISQSKQISFKYNKYGLEKSKLQLEPQLNKDGSEREYIVNPYQIVATNGRYYLICNYDKYDNVSHYRLDRITNLVALDKKRKPMEEVKGLEGGLDLPKHMAEHIYMFTGRSDTVTLRFKKHFLNEFVDWFGTEDIKFFDETKDEVSATVTVNRIAMRKWALQYALHVKILFPESLVDEIKEDIEEAMENYK